MSPFAWAGVGLFVDVVCVAKSMIYFKERNDGGPESLVVKASVMGGIATLVFLGSIGAVILGVLNHGQQHASVAPSAQQTVASTARSLRTNVAPCTLGGHGTITLPPGSVIGCDLNG